MDAAALPAVAYLEMVVVDDVCVLPSGNFNSMPGQGFKSKWSLRTSVASGTFTTGMGLPVHVPLSRGF